MGDVMPGYLVGVGDVISICREDARTRRGEGN